jgi:pyruvate ferredoxin oxidoreductase beta subunit/2-oxoisovalerate ferredoxin oxidoreductase beta subunit
VDLIRLAVQCGLFPLYEVFDGRRYRLNARPDGTPLEQYISRQRRYRSEQLDLEGMKREIDSQWAYLNAMAHTFPAGEGE